MANSLCIDNDVVFLAPPAVVDNPVNQGLLVAVIALRKKYLRAVSMPHHSAMYPALRPITSTMLHRSWDVDVSRILSIASMAVLTAVSNQWYNRYRQYPGQWFPEGRLLIPREDSFRVF